MDKLVSAGPLRQIHIGRGPAGYEDVSAVETDQIYYRWEHETLKAKLMRLCPPPLWPKGSYNDSCPRPILINEQHQQQLQELHDALVASITDILDRWWFDAAADLPGRMPLGEKEQDILKASHRCFASVFTYYTCQ